MPGRLIIENISENCEAEFRKIAELQMRPYLSVSEASRLYGISPDTLRRLIAKGKIPAINLGDRLTRIDRKALEKTLYNNSLPKVAYQVKRTKAPKKTDSPTLEGYCTVSDIVNKYGIDQPRVSAILKKYKLTKVRIGRYTFVPKEQAEELFDKYNSLYSNNEKTLQNKSNSTSAQEPLPR